MPSPPQPVRSSPPLRTLFFDLDDTLCDSQSAFDAGLTPAFHTLVARYPDLTFVRLLENWQDVHKPLFTELNAGRMTMAQVRAERFRRLLRHFGITKPRPLYYLSIVTDGADDTVPPGVSRPLDLIARML